MTGKKGYIRFILVLLITVFISSFAQGLALAEETQFRLDIDSLNLPMGVSSNLVITMNNADGAQVQEVKGIENFNIISTSQATSTQIINNKIANQKAIHYDIMPKKTGQFTLQASVRFNGRTYLTNELQITVSEAIKKSEAEAEDLFLKTLLTDDEIYFGQKVGLTYELYSRYNIENYGFIENLALDGFISKEVGQEQLKANYVYLNNNKYAQYQAKQMYLSPIKTGKYTIPSAKFQVNVSTGNFFSSSKPFYLQTEAKELTVKPLPLENQPADFSGVVGKLKLDSSYSKQEINYGDSIALQIKASGDCNFEALNKITKNGITGFSVYETEKDLIEGIVDNKYQAQKEFEVILVPEKNGEIKIDPIYISYFDPESASYKKAEIPGTTITVKGEVPAVKSGSQSVSAPPETIKISQVSYNTQNEGYMTIQLKKEVLFIGLLILGILAMLAVGVTALLIYRKRGNTALDAIYKQIKKSEDQNAIYNLFNDMIKQCFNISLKANTRKVIIDRLSEYELSSPVQEIMDYMEGGKANSKEGSIHLKNKIKEVYKKLRRIK